MKHTGFPYQTTISCSSNTSTICYFITIAPLDNNDRKIVRFDFSTSTNVTFSEPSSWNHYLTSVVALNDDQMISGGYQTSFAPTYFFYKYDFNTSSKVWEVESATLENVYSDKFKRNMFSFVNDDSSKLINILQVDLFPVVIVLNPADGTLIDARRIENNLTYDSARLQASGKISSNIFLVSIITDTPIYNLLSFINTDTWEMTSYTSENVIKSLGFSSLFNSDQIVLILQDPSYSNFGLQASYDKLHMTELYNQATFTLANVTDNLEFNTSSSTFTLESENATSLTVTPSDATLQTDPAKTYEVTANIFSTSVATLNGDTNSTSLGPIEFDCYSVTTNASIANFSNQLSMTQSDGQAIPSWMEFNSSTASLSLTSPEVSSGTYNVSNLYTGVIGNFTLNTQILINITETIQQTNNQTNNQTNTQTDDDDDSCLGVSSKGLCAFLIIVIISAVLSLIIFIALFIYFKFKCSKGTINRTRLDQEQPNEEIEDQEDNNGHEGDESAHMNQNPEAAQNSKNEAGKSLDDAKSNRV